MPEDLKVPVDIPRQSTTELEMDAVAVDVLNTNDLGDGGGMNPGLTALWDDERERRRLLDIEDPLTPPGSPPRPDKANDSSESELFWYERYRQVVREKKEVSGRSSPPQESQDPDATINMFPSSYPRVYPSETSNRELDLLPEATQLEPHVSSLSQTVMNLSLSNQSAYLDITIPDIMDQTVVDEEVIASQMSASKISDSQEELVDILADLADEAASDNDSDSDMFSDQSQNKSPEQVGEKPKGTIPSQSSINSTVISRDIVAPNDDDDDIETLEMTQVVWNTDPVSGNTDTDDWADLDNTIMEDLARGLDDSNSDIEDMFK